MFVLARVASSLLFSFSSLIKKKKKKSKKKEVEEETFFDKFWARKLIIAFVQYEW